MQAASAVHQYTTTLYRFTGRPISLHLYCVMKYPFVWSILFVLFTEWIPYVPTSIHINQHMFNECYYCCLCKRQVLCMNIQQLIYIYRSTYFTSVVLCNEIAIHMVHFICTVYRMDPICANMHAMSPYILN